MDYSLANVKGAIYALYHSKQQQQADKFLTQFQKEPVAWAIVAELLKSPQSSYEERYFAAQILCSKITNEWSSLDSEKVEQLRVLLVSSIVSVLVQYNNKGTSSEGKVLLNRLCLCLAMWTINRIPEQDIDMDAYSIFSFFTLPNVQFITHAQQPASTEAVDVRIGLLEWLTLLPEQTESASLQHAKKTQVLHQLNKAVDEVLNYILGFLSNPSGTPVNLKAKALRCLLSWIQFGIPLSTIFSGNNAILPLLFGCLHSKDQKELLSPCIKVLIEVLTLNCSTKHNDAIRFYINKVVEFMGPLYQTALRDGDEDTCRSITSLVVGMAEGHTVLLSEGHPECLALAQFLLLCTAHPNKHIAELTYDVWYSLQDTLPEENQRKTFAPVFTQLIDILIRHLEIPEDYSDIDMDEHEFETFRAYTADTLVSAYYLLRGQYVEICFHKYMQCLNQIMLAQQSTNTNNEIPWRPLEAVLFAISAVSENASRGTDFAGLNKIFQAFDSQPQHPALVSAVIFFIGKYAEWISQQPKEYIVWSITYTLNNAFRRATRLPEDASTFGHHSLLLRASNAFRDLCESNAEVLSTMAPDLVNCILETLPVLQNEHSVLVYEGLSYVVAQVGDSELQFKLLSQICSKIAENLNSFLNSTESKETASSISHELHKLKAFLRAFDGSAQYQMPLLNVLQIMWNLLEGVMQKYKDYPQTIEDSCSLLKNIVLSVCGADEEEAEPTEANTEKKAILQSFLNKILNTMCAFYQLTLHPSVLDALTVTAGFVDKKSSVYHTFCNAFIPICSLTFAPLVSDLKAHGDLVKSFFHFVSQILKYHFELIFSDQQKVALLDKVFELGIISLRSFDEKDVCMSVTMFFQSVFAAPEKKRAILQAFVQSYSQQLVTLLLTGVLLNTVAHHNLGYFTDILYDYAVYYPQFLRAFAGNVLSVEGWPAPHITSVEKTFFLKSILTTRNKRMFKSIIGDFMLKIQTPPNTENGNNNDDDEEEDSAM